MRCPTQYEKSKEALVYQVISIVNWRDQAAGDEAHQTMIPRMLDRWEELAPPGAQAFVTRCSDTETTFTALFPSGEGIADDPQRQKLRRIVRAVMRDMTAEGELRILEGEVVANRTSE